MLAFRRFINSSETLLSLCFSTSCTEPFGERFSGAGHCLPVQPVVLLELILALLSPVKLVGQELHSSALALLFFAEQKQEPQGDSANKRHAAAKAQAWLYQLCLIGVAQKRSTSAVVRLSRLC